MGVKKRYKDITEKMKMLQISNHAISEPIINAMQPYITFKDVDSDLGDVIYSGMVFNEIIEGLSNIPLKFIPELKKLDKLARKYDYIMVTDNKKQ